MHRAGYKYLEFYANSARYEPIEPQRFQCDMDAGCMSKPNGASMDRDTAENALITAVQLLKRELPSFGKDVGERTIMCRLAHHLAAQVEPNERHVHVDCEYNRQGDDPKRFRNPPSCELPGKEEDVGGGRKSNRFFPDIVLHQRKADDQNLLVCEIKRKNDPRGCKDDHRRLKKLTCSRGGFRYCIGVFLEVDQANCQVTATYFTNGKLERAARVV